VGFSSEDLVSAPLPCQVVHGAINVLPTAKKFHSFATFIRMCRPLQQQLCRNPHMFLPIPLFRKKKTFGFLDFLFVSV
jgi:hypothetical protein